MKKEYSITSKAGNTNHVAYFNDTTIYIQQAKKWHGANGNPGRNEVKNLCFDIDQIKEMYAALGEIIKESETGEKWFPYVFSIDGEYYKAPGYTNYSTWNGWECPVFTFENASTIMDEFNSNELNKAWYDENEDAFYFFDGYAYETIEEAKEDNAIDVCKGFTIRVLDNDIKVYSIGDGWIWNKKEVAGE